MHYHAEIWLEDLNSVEEQIAKIMKPYDENEVDEGSFWDWYQLGGRWTGIHDSKYKPEDDPSNVEICTLCDGTGFRNDTLGKEERLKDPTYTCNACGNYDQESKRWIHGGYGLGKCLKWPTEWIDFDGDIASVDEIESKLQCFTLMINEKVYHQNEWNSKASTFEKTDFDGNVRKKLDELKITSGYLVTVDYHC